MVYPGRLYDLTLVTEALVVYSSKIWNEDPSCMQHIVERTKEFQSANQKFARFVTTGILEADIVNMTEFEIVRQEFESAARKYNYYVNLYEGQIVNAPVIYAQHQIDLFQEQYSYMSQAYSELLNTIGSTIAFLRDVDMAWNEVREVKLIYDKYIEDQATTKSFVALVFTSDGFQEQMSILENFFDEISTRSIDATSKLDLYRQRYINLWHVMVEERSLFQFYQALHDDVMNGNSLTNSTILHAFSAFTGQNETWLLNNWEELHLYLNADLASLEHASKIEELMDEFMGQRQILDITGVIGQADDQFFDTIHEIQSHMHEFLLGKSIGESFYR